MIKFLASSLERKKEKKIRIEKKYIRKKKNSKIKITLDLEEVGKNLEDLILITGSLKLLSSQCFL